MEAQFSKGELNGGYKENEDLSKTTHDRVLFYYEQICEKT